jgi:transposase InsO family protein
MPWKATDPLKERTKFLLEWERRWDEAQGGAVNLAELCRMFGISRPTGYAWVKRYREASLEIVAAIAERSRRPKTSPTAIPEEMADLIVEARKKHPKWGPRKLRAWIVELNPGTYVPSASVMAKVLKQRGLTTTRHRRRRPKTAGVTAPFSECNAPNDVWCIDFKGWFETGDGRRCYPLTLLDAYSRFLLRCEGLLEPDGKHVRSVLDSAFLEFGLPKAIRSDGGPPFASTGPARLTELSVWLLRLGVRIEIIAPGKPQQNGRLERFHRTLAEETASPPQESCVAQQRRFDLHRREYNHERPHESLGMRAPARIYTPSRRTYPRPLLRRAPEPFSREVRVDKHGFILWNRRKVFISSALRCEYIELEFDPDGRWAVRWGAIPLGLLDEHAPKRGLIVARRRRGDASVVGQSYIDV